MREERERERERERRDGDGRREQYLKRTTKGPRI